MDAKTRAERLLSATDGWFPFTIDPTAVTTEELALAGLVRCRRLLEGMIRVHNAPDLAALLTGDVLNRSPELCTRPICPVPRHQVPWVHDFRVVVDQDVVARIERVAALDAAAVAAPLDILEPALAPTAKPLAGGFAVILGPGMYINRGIGMGVGVETTIEHLTLLDDLSRRAGVASEIEISPWVHPSLLTAAAAEGYMASWFRSCLLCEPGTQPTTTPDRSGITISNVSNSEELSQWQEAAATGFGYTSQEQRRISDLFTAAIASLDNYRLYVAKIHGSVVGCASLSMRDGVATLGGMATAPAARGQGVQRELIRHRLEAALGAGCDLAMTTAAPGSTSERNLIRSGFSIVFTKLGVVKPR